MRHEANLAHNHIGQSINVFNHFDLARVVLY